MLFRIVKDHGNAFPPSRIVWIAPASSHQHAAGGGIVILTTGVWYRCDMQISLTNMLKPSPAVVPRSAFFPFPHKTVEKKRRYHDGFTVFFVR